MQVAILHKEIGLKIAEFVHFAKHRPQRGAGVRGRAAQKKTHGIIHPTGHRANPQPKFQAHHGRIHRSDRTSDS